MPSVYLAGPDIFYQDSDQRRKYLLSLCQQYGFQGIYLGDNDIEPPSANAIRLVNLQLLRKSDYVIANLNSFRGFEPDSGTVYEVGFAMALNKTVVAYSSDTRSMINRLREHQSLSDEQMVDKDGLLIENFNLPNNLMFGHIVMANTPDDAIKIIHKLHHEKSDEEKLWDESTAIGKEVI